MVRTYAAGRSDISDAFQKGAMESLNELSLPRQHCDKHWLLDEATPPSLEYHSLPEGS